MQLALLKMMLACSAFLNNFFHHFLSVHLESEITKHSGMNQDVFFSKLAILSSPLRKVSTALRFHSPGLSAARGFQNRSHSRDSPALWGPRLAPSPSPVLRPTHLLASCVLENIRL